MRFSSQGTQPYFSVNRITKYPISDCLCCKQYNPKALLMDPALHANITECTVQMLWNCVGYAVFLDLLCGSTSSLAIALNLCQPLLNCATTDPTFTYLSFCWLCPSIVFCVILLWSASKGVLSKWKGKSSLNALSIFQVLLENYKQTHTTVFTFKSFSSLL